MSRQSIPSVGLTAVVNPAKPSLDLVFVHGFTGHPVRTWTHNKGDVSQQSHDENEFSEPPAKKPKLNLFSKSRQESCHTSIYWPEDLVPSTVPGARVLTYGYDTHIRHKLGPPGSRNTIYDIAWDFLVALEAERREEPLRPIIFVVHSLGGIVVKEMLRRSSECYQSQTHLHDTYVSTIGIMFFGTPHSGADPRSFLHRIAEKVFKVVGFSVDEQIVNSLLPSSERLKELRDAFGPRAVEQNWIIHSFQEQIGLKALGDYKVVEDTSSYLGLPNIEITEHIGRNHMEMCRFSGPNDFEYRKVASALRRMINSISKQPLMKEKSTVSGEQTKLLLESLRFDQINARQMTIKKAHVKTCKWLFTKSEYLDWLDQAKLSEHHGFLWIKGKPGTGKSTLMKSLLANTKKLMKDKVVISFFFNARGEELEKNTLGTYQSLLLQLLERLPALESVFETLDLSTKTIGETHQWSVDSLKTLLEEAILRLGETPVVCLIDALDECDERQIRDMISFFEHIGQLTLSASISFQVCFSSRHYPHITIGSGITLVLEGQEGHTHDITTYLESELKIGHSKVAGQIRHEIQEKASGVFLWVVLVVEILNKEHDSGRIPALKRRLREIPGDLHELFNNILTRDPHNRDELILCLQWILFAKQPLTPEQLYFAIVSGSEPQDLSIWDPEEISISDIQRFILNASKGLAETTTSKTPKIQFIHESVKDFLEKENGLGRIWSDLESNFKGQSHERLKQCCMKYIDIEFATRLQIDEVLPKASSDEAAKLRKRVNVDLPFLDYATHHVLYHADMAEGFGITQESFIREFQLDRWIWFNNLFEEYHVRRHTPKASLLYLLAEYDMSNLIRIHPSISSFFETGDERYGCPLFAALATNSDKSVLAFLQACAESQPKLQQLCQQFEQDRGEIQKIGLDFQFPKRGNIFSCIVEIGDMTLFKIACAMIDFSPDTTRTAGRSLLSRAAEIGHESIAKHLLDHNASKDLKDKKGRTPLSYAASNGHAAVVRTLLDHNSSTETEDQYGKTPLWYAAERGDDSIVKMLLENKTAINSQNVNGRTLLGLAAENGHETIVRLLLEKKAVVDSQRADGQTPLMLAAKNGHEAVVKVLLENNAVLDSFDGSSRTPLMLAAWTGHEAVVKVLLENMAATDVRDEDGSTPLVLAARRGHESILSLLLVIELKDIIGAKPLPPDTARNLKAVFKLLLDTGKFDVNSRIHDGYTILSLVALCGCVDIVKLLLDIGNVDVDLKNHEGNTPLSLAVQCCHDKIVKLLLGTNKVDVDSKNREGNTPLSLAARYGYNHIVESLLDTGIGDLDLKNHEGNTSLALAARNGYNAVVKLLLDTGEVDVNSKNDAGETPLMMAAAASTIIFENNTVVMSLLDTGKVDIHIRNNAGQTAQMLAEKDQRSGIVKLLEEYSVSKPRSTSHLIYTAKAGFLALEPEERRHRT